MTSQPIHGNYTGYYTKRPSLSDQRLSLLPEDFFKGKKVLDVGCNEGWVTCEIGTRQFRTARPTILILWYCSSEI